MKYTFLKLIKVQFKGKCSAFTYYPATWYQCLLIFRCPHKGEQKTLARRSLTYKWLNR